MNKALLTPQHLKLTQARPFVAATVIAFLIFAGSALALAQTEATTPSPTPETSIEAEAVVEQSIEDSVIETVKDAWFMQLFGPGMWPLWVCSIVLVALAIDRSRSLQIRFILDPAMVDKVSKSLTAGDTPAAIEAAASSKTVIGGAWHKALKEFALGGIPLQEALLNASLLSLRPLKKNLQAISTIAAIAPLFGLLGTIFGMILAFSRIAETGGADKSQLAGAISLALFTTAGGLIVAIPAIIIGRYFNARLVGCSEQVEAAIQDVNSQYLHARHADSVSAQ